GIDALVVQVPAFEQDLAFGPECRDEVVHAVEATDERALAAPGGPDERGELAVGDPEVDVAQGLEGAVVDVEVLHLQVILGRQLSHTVIIACAQKSQGLPEGCRAGLLVGCNAEVRLYHRRLPSKRLRRSIANAFMVRSTA